MAKAPNMKIGIGADTSDFEKGTKKVKQGLGEIASESKAFGGALKSLAGTGAAAFAGVAAAVAGTIKVVKDLAQQNQALGDAWEQTCANMTGAFDSFKTAVANMDFTHLFSNMREAGRLAQELYDARDGLGEVSTSYNMSLARQMKTINDLKLALQDTSKTDQERVEAGNKLLAIYQKLEQNPTRALSRISDASLDVVANKLGYDLKGLSPEELDKTRKYVENFFIWLGTEAGESWSSAYAAAFKDPAKLFQTTVNAQNAGMSEAYRTMLWNYQAAVGDKDREQMEQAVVAYYQQEAKYSEETFRIRKQIASINAASDKAGASGGAAAAAAAKKNLEEQLQLLGAMAKRQENDERLAGLQGLSFLTGNVTTPKLTVLPQVEPEYWKDIINAQLGDITIGIGFEANTEKLHDITNEVNSLISSGVSRSAELIGNLVGTLAGGGDAWGDFKNAALSAFGDMAIAVGKIAISAGLASEGIKAALKLDNPYVAIAAGAALIALGTAVKSSLSAVASGDYSAGGGAYASGGGNYSSNDYETRDIQVNVNGKLTADGDQLLAVINSTNNRNYYTQ